MASSGEHVNVLSNFKDNLELVIQQIRDGESKKNEKAEFNKDEYWKHVAVVIKMLSMECTKLSMAFSSPPFPTQTECEALIRGLEKSTLALVSCYYSLPKTQGLTLRKELQKTVLMIVGRVQALVECVTVSTGTNEQLRSTGIVWEETDDFQNISQDNRQATLSVLQQTMELVKDAFREIEEAIEAESGGLSQLLDVDDIDELNNEDSWSEGDKNFINTSLGLMKTIKSLLKKTKEALKTNGSCCTEQNISQMDDLADFLKRLSPVVDDMTIVLYPPIVASSVTSKVNSLAGNLSDILNFLKSSHMTTAEDEKWIDFLFKAKQHNVDKIFEALNDVS